MADRSVRAVVVLEPGINRADVERALPAQGTVEVVETVDWMGDAWDRLNEVVADVVIIGCTNESDYALNLITELVRDRPSRPVVVLTHHTANGFTAQLFGAGADDVLLLPISAEDVRFAIEKTLARKAWATDTAPLRRAPIVCVLGPKGGTGKTLTSTSLAVALADAGKRVALIDLDLQFGDVGLCLGLVPRHTIFDLVRTGGTLDADKLEGFMVRHVSGVKVLMAPARPDQAAVVSVDFLRDVYSTLRHMVDFILVDTPPGFTPEVIATIDNASHVCMVGMLDALSLKNTKLGLETLDLMGFPDDRVKLILNRAHSHVGISDEDVVSILGRQPDVLVPSDRNIPRAVNEGRPIVMARPGSVAAKAFKQLATLIIDGELAATAGR